MSQPHGIWRIPELRTVILAQLPAKEPLQARAVCRDFRALSTNHPYLASEIYLRPKHEKKIFWIVNKDKKITKTHQEDKNFGPSTFNDQCRRLLHVNEHVAAAVHLFPIREDTDLALRALDPYDYISLHPKILLGVACGSIANTIFHEMFLSEPPFCDANICWAFRGLDYTHDQYHEIHVAGGIRLKDVIKTLRAVEGNRVVDDTKSYIEIPKATVVSPEQKSRMVPGEQYDVPSNGEYSIKKYLVFANIRMQLRAAACPEINARKRL